MIQQRALQWFLGRNLVQARIIYWARRWCQGLEGIYLAPENPRFTPQNHMFSLTLLGVLPPQKRINQMLTFSLKEQ